MKILIGFVLIFALVALGCSDDTDVDAGAVDAKAKIEVGTDAKAKIEASVKKEAGSPKVEAGTKEAGKSDAPAPAKDAAPPKG